MLVVGLTGGIGSGKTLASDYFASLKVPVVDADVISHQLLSPGSPLLDEVRTDFGNAFFLDNGHLDRTRLGKHIFRNPAAKNRLESLLHPAIRSEIIHQLDQIEASYALVVIPLLAETGNWNMLDRILLIDAPESTQVHRVMHRDQRSALEIRNIIKSQASRSQRLAIADDIILNDGTPQQFRRQLDKLHSTYLKLCNNRH